MSKAYNHLEIASDMSLDINSLIPSLLAEYSHRTIMVSNPYQKHYGTYHRVPKMRKGSWCVRISKRWWRIESAKKIGPSTFLFSVELPGWWH